MPYRGADDEAVGPLPLVEGQPLLLLQGEHDDGQSEDESFSRTGEGNANHVPAWKTEHIKTMSTAVLMYTAKYFTSLLFQFIFGVALVFLFFCTVHDSFEVNQVPSIWVLLV